MKKYICLFLIVLFISAKAQTGKQIKYNNLIWLSDFSRIELNKKWSIYFDFSLRRKDWLNQWSQTASRPGVEFKLNNNIVLASGCAWFKHYSETIDKNEYRLWEQLLFTENYSAFKISHRLRVEQRYLQKISDKQLVNQYQYINRFRYQLNVQVPLNKKTIDINTIYLSLADEIMINAGKDVIVNYFDQNRFTIGVGYKYRNWLNLTLNYMNVFIQKNTINNFDQNNVIVLNLYHTFNLKKKNKDVSN